MKKSLLQLVAAGLVIVGAHWILMDTVLPEEWSTKRVYLYDPILFFLSFLIVFFTGRIKKSQPDKAGLYYSFMTVAKLLILAVLFLIESKMNLAGDKFVIIAHFILPAFIFIGLETILVRKLLTNGE